MKEARMTRDPKPEYEAPSVEQVHTEDSPVVTAAGADSPTDQTTTSQL
jgi:hypothetical protein